MPQSASMAVWLNALWLWPQASLGPVAQLSDVLNVEVTGMDIVAPIAGTRHNLLGNIRSGLESRFSVLTRSGRNRRWGC